MLDSQTYQNLSIELWNVWSLIEKLRTECEVCKQELNNTILEKKVLDNQYNILLNKFKAIPFWNWNIVNWQYSNLQIDYQLQLINKVYEIKALEEKINFLTNKFNQAVQYQNALIWMSWR